MSDFNETKKEIIDRYNIRFKEHGIHPHSLNWKDKESQSERFRNFLSLLDIEEKKLIDIGCGFGDLYKFITDQNKIFPKKYTGIDINPDFINNCKSLYPEADFFESDLIKDELPQGEFDIALMIGMLSYKFKNYDNIEFTKKVIKKIFCEVKEALIFDMQSSYINPDYPTADHIFYQNPQEILDFALTLTPHVILKHNYKPNPAREFIVLLSHNAM